SAGEYLTRMLGGWRRFGKMLFRPRCEGCSECRAVRVRVADFRPDRSQRRTRRANEDVALRIGKPTLSRSNIALYHRDHSFPPSDEGWPEHPADDAASYAESFVYPPCRVEEWCCFVGRRLVGVGYVDALTDAPEPIPEDEADRHPLPLAGENVA